METSEAARRRKTFNASSNHTSSLLGLPELATMSQPLTNCNLSGIASFIQNQRFHLISKRFSFSPLFSFSLYSFFLHSKFSFRSFPTLYLIFSLVNNNGVSPFMPTAMISFSPFFFNNEGHLCNLKLFYFCTFLSRSRGVCITHVIF